MIMQQNDAWIKETWQKIESKMRKTVERNRGIIPYTTKNGRFVNKYAEDPDCWVNGFWGGILWLMYAATGEELYKQEAQVSERLLDKALANYEMLNHDVGFMWHLTSGASYKLTGSEVSKTRNLFAAATLSSRYNISGGYIRAWNKWSETELNDRRSIIDCMMNLPLLYWASEVTGNENFKKVAMAHADMAMRDHVRADGSVNHIVDHDTRTGEVLDTPRGQGYASGSSWSRGVAWALYGFVLSYIHTGKQEYIDTAKKVAHYFIACVCDDWISRVDFRSPSEPDMIDTTADACAACGLLEIANCADEFEKQTYANAAVKILKALDEKYANWNENEDSILGGGTEMYHSETGHNIPIIYGDYFFIEAFYKLNGFDKLLWK